MKRAAQASHPKRPHILPPLPTAKGASPSLNDTLHPPSSLLLEGRLGSPAPRWQRPSSEDIINLQETIPEGKPLIRIAPVLPDDIGNSTLDQRRRDSLRFDLKNDPIFKEENELLPRFQKRNSTKKGHSLTSTLEAVKRMKGTIDQDEGNTEKDLSFTSRRAAQILENQRKKDFSASHKPAHFSSGRYALLKPIRKSTTDKPHKK